MKHCFFMMLLGSFLLAPAGLFAADKYTIDPAHTFPNFTVSHLGFSTMHGRFGKTSGTMEINQEKKTGSVNITVDTASINTGHVKRDEHLSSPDFFNVIEFPVMTFKSSSVNIGDDGIGEAKGTLTLLGVSKPLTLSLDRFHCGAHPMKKETYVCGFDASGSFKRSDFGMTYALPAVGDEITLMIEAEAHKD